MAQELGFVGVGRMGGPMAVRLLDAGYPLTVYDTNADAVKALFRDRRFSESRTWDHFRSNAEILQLELKHQSSMRMLFGHDPPINLSERRRT